MCLANANTVERPVLCEGLSRIVTRLYNSILSHFMKASSRTAELVQLGASAFKSKAKTAGRAGLSILLAGNPVILYKFIGLYYMPIPINYNRT